MKRKRQSYSVDSAKKTQATPRAPPLAESDEEADGFGESLDDCDRELLGQLIEESGEQSEEEDYEHRDASKDDNGSEGEHSDLEDESNDASRVPAAARDGANDGSDVEKASRSDGDTDDDVINSLETSRKGEKFFFRTK